MTRLAHGVPVGGELDYLDEGTLAAAIRSRTPFCALRAGPACKIASDRPLRDQSGGLLRPDWLAPNRRGIAAVPAELGPPFA